MLDKLVFVLCLFAVGEAYYQTCSLRSCTNNFLSTRNKDFQECLDDLNKAETCFEDAVKGNACQTCDSTDFNHYTRPGYIPERKSMYCYSKPCKEMELYSCMSHVVPALTYLSPSSMDGLTSCIESWTPELDSRTCVNGLLMSDIPSSVDVVHQIKKIISEMKNGCDPVLPLAECRRHLLPLKNLYYRPDSITVEGMGKAIGEAYTCVQTAIKKYPCKTIEGLLAEPWMREVLVKHIPQHVIDDPGNRYVTHCGTANDNPRFLRYFKK